MIVGGVQALCFHKEDTHSGPKPFFIGMAIIPNPYLFIGIAGMLVMC